jgi:hypothetical protein
MLRLLDLTVMPAEIHAAEHAKGGTRRVAFTARLTDVLDGRHLLSEALSSRTHQNLADRLLIMLDTVTSE